MSVSSYSGVESKTLVVRQDIKEDIRGKNVFNCRRYFRYWKDFI